MPIITHEAFGKKKKVRATFFWKGRVVPKNEAEFLAHDKVIVISNNDELHALSNSELREMVVAVITEDEWERGEEVS